MKYIKAALTLMLSLTPSAIWAHPNGHFGAAFADGFAHPFSGADHVMAMAALGLWAAIYGGRARWAMPLMFVAALIAGGVLGVAGGGVIAAIQPLILASVLLFGIAAALALDAPLGLCLPFIALFGAAHGIAHGLEAPMIGAALPVTALPVTAFIGAAFTPYAAGFALASVALHGVGMALGIALNRTAARGVGAACVAAGLILIMA